MASKTLNYDEFIEYAQKYYNKGGDGYVECWGQRDFDYYVKEFGPITKKSAREMFRIDYELEREMAGWARF